MAKQTKDIPIKYFGADFRGQTRVFRQERQSTMTQPDGGNKFYSYSATLSQKDKDGEFINASIDLQFKKGDAPEYWTKGKRSDGTAYYYCDIEVTDGFLTFRKYRDKDGRQITRWICMVLSWDEAEEE